MSIVILLLKFGGSSNISAKTSFTSEEELVIEDGLRAGTGGERVAEGTLFEIDEGFLPGRGGDLGDRVVIDCSRSTDCWRSLTGVWLAKPTGSFALRPASSIAASSSLRVGNLTGDLARLGCNGFADWPHIAATPFTEGKAGLSSFALDSPTSCSLDEVDCGSCGCDRSNEAVGVAAEVDIDDGGMLESL